MPIFLEVYNTCDCSTWYGIKSMVYVCVMVFWSPPLQRFWFSLLWCSPCSWAVDMDVVLVCQFSDPFLSLFVTLAHFWALSIKNYFGQKDLCYCHWLLFFFAFMLPLAVGFFCLQICVLAWSVLLAYAFPLFGYSLSWYDISETVSCHGRGRCVTMCLCTCVQKK